MAMMRAFQGEGTQSEIMQKIELEDVPKQGSEVKYQKAPESV